MSRKEFIEHANAIKTAIDKLPAVAFDNRISSWIREIEKPGTHMERALSNLRAAREALETIVKARDL